MTTLSSALFRIDPTEGFSQYVREVKPFHTKILETLVEYVYTDEVNVTITEAFRTNIRLMSEPKPSTYSCGWGNVWDAFDAEPELVVQSNSFNNSFVVPSSPLQQQTFIVSDLTTSKMAIVGPPLQWKRGTPVSVTSSNVMPVGMSPTSQYYFIPSAITGEFNLARVPYPQTPSDYVRITTVGIGTLTITRSQKYNPGFPISVTGSYLRRNDGLYIIQQVVDDGSFTTLFVEQPVNSTFVPSPTRVTDGTLGFADPYLDQFGGSETGYGVAPFGIFPYDGSLLPCALASADSLFTQTTISEQITFEFELSIGDITSAVLYEDQPSGYGVLPFGDSPYDQANATSANTVPNTSLTILPTGFDVQTYDMGGFDENLSTVQQLLGTPASS